MAECAKPVESADLGGSPDAAACLDPRWEKLSPGPERLLFDLHGIGASTLFGIDEYYRLVRGDGAGWTVESITWRHPGNSHWLNRLWGSDLQNLYAVGSEFDPGPAVDCGFAVDAGRPPHASGGFNALLLKRGASGWEEAPAAQFTGLAHIWGSDAKNIFMAGRSVQQSGVYNQMVRFDGVSFTTWPLPPGVRINGVWGTGPTNVYAVGDRGAVFRFDGTSWAAMSSPGDVQLKAMWGSRPADLFAVGQGIYHFDGKTWTTLQSHGGAPIHVLNDVWGLGPASVFAVGMGGTVKHYDGKTWTSTNVEVGGHLWSIWGKDRGNAYISGGAYSTNKPFVLRLKCGAPPPR